MSSTSATPAVQALAAFEIDGYRPFVAHPDTATGLLTEAHGMLKVLSTAYADSQAATKKGLEAGLLELNPDFIASALNGIGSLVAMALFLQEQAQ